MRWQTNKSPASRLIPLRSLSLSLEDNNRKHETVKSQNKTFSALFISFDVKWPSFHKHPWILALITDGEKVFLFLFFVVSLVHFYKSMRAPFKCCLLLLLSVTLAVCFVCEWFCKWLFTHYTVRMDGLYCICISYRLFCGRWCTFCTWVRVSKMVLRNESSHFYSFPWLSNVCCTRIKTH